MMTTTSRKTTASLQSFKDSLLLTGGLGLEDQVEAVQFLEERLEVSRKLAVKKCEDLKRALVIKAENNGEPPEKKPRLEPSIEFSEVNGNVPPENMNNLLVEQNNPEHDANKSEEVSEGSRRTRDSDEQLVILKKDLEDALKNVKRKEVEAEQLRKTVAVKDDEMKSKEQQLTEALTRMSAEKRLLEEKLAGQTKALETVKQQVNVAQQEVKKMSTTLLEKVRELHAAEKLRNALQQNYLANISKHKVEIAKVKKEAEEIKSVEYDNVKVRNDLEVALKAAQAEAEQLKKAVVGKDAEFAKVKSTVIQLKKIARGFREKAEHAEKTVYDLTVEKEEIIAKPFKGEGNLVGSDGISCVIKDLLETNHNHVKELGTQTRESKKENLSENFDVNEECAKNVLKKVDAKIIKVDEERKELLQQPFGSAVTTSQTLVLPSLVTATIQPTVSNELGEAQGLGKAHQIHLSEL